MFESAMDVRRTRARGSIVYTADQGHTDPTMLPLLCSFAVAAPPSSPGDLVDAEWRAAQVLRVRPEAYRVITEPFTIDEGPLKVTLSQGVLVPVFSGVHPDDREGLAQIRAEAFALDSGTPPVGAGADVTFVGFVFTAAEGTFEVTWQERADSLVFANHQVMRLGGERSDWADVAHGAPWTGAVQEGFVLSSDPRLAELFVGPDDPEGSPEDIVVYGHREHAAARARARVLFHDRRERMRQSGFEPGRGIASDRIARAHGLKAAGVHHVIDLHIDQNLGAPSQPPGHQPADIDWMSLMQDWTGGLDARRHTVLLALDATHDERLVDHRITGIPFPPSDPTDPASAPRPEVRLETEEAYVVVQAVPIAAQLRAEVVARLKLRAVGGDFQSFQLDVPRHGSQHDWRLIGVTDADGVSLTSSAPLIEHSHQGLSAESAVVAQRETSGPGSSSRNPTRGSLQTVTADLVAADAREPLLDVSRNKPLSRVSLSLAEPIREGEVRVVDVRWSDVWPYGDLDFGMQGSLIRETSDFDSNGPASGAQPVLPIPVGTPRDSPTRFRIQIVVPERSRLAAASSGALEKTWSADGYRHVVSAQLDRAVPHPEVHVGAFTVHDEPPGGGLPTVRTRTFRADTGAVLARETRDQIAFLQRYLPSYPWPEHEVALGPETFDDRWWASAHGLTGAGASGVTPLLRADNRAGHPARLGMTHELAHQWFGQSVRPADRSDAWFEEALAEVLGVLYLRSRYGDTSKVYARKRRKFETMVVVPTSRLSLVSAHESPYAREILFDYGPYLMNEMLRPRMGNRAYFAAVDGLARDHSGAALTTEQLQRQFAGEAERDLTDFFDFWVYGGFVPRRVALDWSWEAGSLSARVESDVPFGTFDVPVAIDGQEHWIEVVDGSGQLVLDVPSEPGRVELDPDHRILAAHRTSRRR